MEKDRNYFMLPWYKKLIINTKDKFVEWKKNYKFPWVKVLIFVLIIVTIASIVLIVATGKRKFPIRPSYDTTGFVAYEELEGTSKVYENSNYKFELDYETTHFKFVDKTNNVTWLSSPEDKTDVDTLTLYYSKGLGEAKEYGNYNYSIDYDGNKFYSMRFDETNKSVEVLYKVGGKIHIDYTDFPNRLTYEKYDLYCSKINQYIESLKELGDADSLAKAKTAESDLKALDKLYQKETEFYILTNASSLSSIAINRLQRLFYEYMNYTIDDLRNDNAEFGDVIEKSYPQFNIAIKYTLLENGLDIRLVNSSINDTEESPLIYVDILPYLGCGSETDNGYAMVPDGSGVLIDFNNSRSYASRYEQRLYGRDYGISKYTMDLEKGKVSLGVYGMKVNDHGFINIVKEGAESCSLISSSATMSDKYNKTYYRFYNREKDTYKFASMENISDISSWTNDYNTSDVNLELRVTDNNGSYSEMAKTYQTYLVENALLNKVDNTNDVVLNLTLLGGYLKQTNFIGFPYTKVESLTNDQQVLEIVNMLQNDNIQNINVLYEGFSNEGIKSTYIGKLHFNNIIASKKDMKNLNSKLEEMNVNFYPNVRVSSAYTNKNLDKDDIIKNMYGDTIVRYDNDEPSYLLDKNSKELYTLKATTFSDTYKKLTKALNKIGINSIGMKDFGNELYGSYQSKGIEFRSDVLREYHNTMKKYSETYDNIAIEFPNDYALKYANLVLDIPISGTNYQIVKQSVPFYQLVISGYLDYSSEAFNLNDKYSFNYYKMKAIETCGNVSMTWTYSDTIDLIGTEYDSYYSTYYKNWYDETIGLINEMNTVGVYNTFLVGHETLTDNAMVLKSIYANNMEIVFNYQNTQFTYMGRSIEANSYCIVREGN